jgi:hypothetical protein
LLPLYGRNYRQTAGGRFARHDWVFASEVLKVFGNPADGGVISLKDGRDHLLVEQLPLKQTR